MPPIHVPNLLGRETLYIKASPLGSEDHGLLPSVINTYVARLPHSPLPEENVEKFDGEMGATKEPEEPSESPIPILTCLAPIPSHRFAQKNNQHLK